MMTASWVGETVLSGSLVLAVPVALAAGLVSFFSPCVVPLLPGYLSYMTGVGVQDLPDAKRGRLVVGAALFVAGFSAVFVAGGTLFGAAGAKLAMHQDVINVVAGLLVIALGLAFIGLVPLLQRDVRVHAIPAVGLVAAPVLGALFGIGWSPCIGPALASVLLLAGSEGTAGRGAFLTLVYCIGLGLPFIAAALFFSRFMGAIGWVRRHQRAVSIAGGVLLIVTGVLLATGWWDNFMFGLRGSVSSFQVAI